MINQQQLVDWLQMTLQAKTIQDGATLIQNARFSEGFTIQLLLIVDNHSYGIDIRQTALVTLKTTVDALYSPHKPGDPELSANDKNILRGSILEALVRSCDQPKLSPLFSEIVYVMARQDYPQRWPDLLEKIVINLKTNESFSVLYGSLVALKSLINIYNDVMEEERSGLFVIVAATFPCLQMLASKLFQNFNDQTSTLLLLILKVFSAATYTGLPPNLKSSESLHVWLIFFKKALDCPMNETSPEALFKIKHKSSKIVYRFIQHHANPKYDKQYAQYFFPKYSIPFLESFVLQLLTPITGNWREKLDKVALLSFPYFYKYPNCKQLLDRYKDKIIPIVMNRATLTMKDLDTWLNDPVEFVHKEKEIRKEVVDVMRMYDDSPQLITAGLVNVLRNPTSTDIQKEIYLYMFSELPIEITDKIDQPNLIDLLTSLIIPLMSHQSQLLRARSCEVFTSYEDLPLGQSALQAAAGSIYKCFTSGSIPIRTHASIALSSLLCKYENLVGVISPYLADVLANYLKLIDTVDSEDVVYAFESVITKLADKIQPFAIQVVKSLQAVFYRFCEKEGIIANKDQEEDGEDEFDQNTGTGCLGAIRQVLLCNLQEEVYLQLTPEIYNLVTFIFADQSYSFLEEGLNILNIFIFKISQIPQQIVQLFPIVVYMTTGVPLEVMTLPNKDPLFTKMVNNIAEGTDKEILNQVIGSIRNYIAKMKAKFFLAVDIAGVTFINRIWQALEVAQKAGNKDKLAITETLLLTIIENNFGTIDAIIPNILTFAITELKQSLQHARLRLINLEVFLLSFFYNATLTLQLLQSQNLTDSLLTLLLQNINLFKADYEKQRLMLGLIRLLEINEAVLDPTVVGQKYAKPIINYLVELAKEIVEIRGTDNKSESEASEAEEDNSHVFNVVNQPKDEEDDIEVQWEEQYNKLYQSPLEMEDEITYLKNFLQGSGSRFIHFLSIPEQELLTEIISKAEHLKRQA